MQPHLHPFFQVWRHVYLQAALAELSELPRSRFRRLRPSSARSTWGLLRHGRIEKRTAATCVNYVSAGIRSALSQFAPGEHPEILRGLLWIRRPERDDELEPGRAELEADGRVERDEDREGSEITRPARKQQNAANARIARRRRHPRGGSPLARSFSRARASRSASPMRVRGICKVSDEIKEFH